MPSDAKLPLLINATVGHWWEVSCCGYRCTGRTGQGLRAAPLDPDLVFHYWSVIVFHLDMENIFHVLQNVFFIFCLSVFLRLHIFLLFFVYLIHPTNVFHEQVEDVSKDILIFLPVDCLGWKTLRERLVFCQHLRFLFMACHYLIQLFIPLHHCHFSSV